MTGGAGRAGGFIVSPVVIGTTSGGDRAVVQQRAIGHRRIARTSAVPRS